MPEKRRLSEARWILTLLAALGVGWITGSLWAPSHTARKMASPLAADTPHGVGCIGHFLPEHGVVRVAAPYYQSRPSVVAHLAVGEGEEVRAGQLIADLDGKAQVEAQLQTARAQLEQARRRLTQTKAGAKTNELNAQQAEVERLEVSYRLAESQFQRSESLFSTRNISKADLDASRSAKETSRSAWEEAKYRLASLSEVRQADINVAESDVAVSEAQVRQTETQLAALTVVAPAAGLITKVTAHEGEQVGPDGLIELADLRNMVVEAEVYASDIARVHIGQRACAEMEDSATRKCGSVTWIGAEVRQAEVLPNDPVAYSDAHVVPVRISIADCGGGSCPIHARVKVRIGTDQ
jgi:HlyD family secretion protein